MDRILNNSRLIPFNSTVTKPENFNGQGMVSFSYDDGRVDNYELALRLHRRYNVPASFNIISGRLDLEGFVEPRHIRKLEQGGMEIASHSVNHYVLSSTGRMHSELTESETHTEAGQSKTDIEATGISNEVVGYAVPGSKYADFQVDIMKQYYQYVRCWYGRGDDPNALPESASDTDDNKLISYPMKDPYDIACYPVNDFTTPERVIGLIDRAMNENKYIIFMMHFISDGDEGGNGYTWDKAKLEQVLSYIASQPKDVILPVNMRDGVTFAQSI